MNKGELISRVVVGGFMLFTGCGGSWNTPNSPVKTGPDRCQRGYGETALDQNDPFTKAITPFVGEKHPFNPDGLPLFGSNKTPDDPLLEKLRGEGIVACDSGNIKSTVGGPIWPILAKLMNTRYGEGQVSDFSAVIGAYREDGKGAKIEGFRVKFNGNEYYIKRTPDLGEILLATIDFYNEFDGDRSWKCYVDGLNGGVTGMDENKLGAYDSITGEYSGVLYLGKMFDEYDGEIINLGPPVEEEQGRIKVRPKMVMDGSTPIKETHRDIMTSMPNAGGGKRSKLIFPPKP